MKTIREYEASDVDLGDPRDAAIAVGITGALVTMMSKTKALPMLASREDTDGILKNAVALFRSITEQQGYELIKREEVPAVFRD